MNPLADNIIRFRWPVIIGFILVSLILGFQIRRAEIDTDLKSQLPKNMPSRLNIDKIDTLFGGNEMLMVLLRTDDVLNPETLKRVKKISKEVGRVQGVDRVLSLFELKSVKAEDGAMVVEPAVKQIPKDSKEREILREEIRSNDMVYGNVVSKDFTLTSVIAMLRYNVKDKEIIPKFEAIIEKNRGPEEILLGGLPYTRYQMGDYIKKDIRHLLPIGIFIMLAFLFACFRQLRGVVLPFLVVMMSILVSMGVITVFGWKIHIVTVILPVLMIAVANNYGIHLIAKYQEMNVPENTMNPREMSRQIFTNLGRPVFLSGLTTIAGMLCLLSHVLLPAKQLGILAAIGIAFALMASLFFIPAVLSMLPRPKPILAPLKENTQKKFAFDRMLWHFGRFVVRYPKLIIAAGFLLAVISVAGIFFIVVDTNPSSYYGKNHPTARAAEMIDNYLGGSQNISIVYQGDIKDPRLLKKMDAMERSLESMEEVGNTVSIARVIRQMSRALNDPGDPMYDAIPDERNAVAQYFELYSMSGDPKDFEKMVDFPYEHAILTARINKTSTTVLNKIIRRIQDMVAGDKDVLLVGGFGVVLSDLAHGVVDGQILSLLFATALVAVHLMVLFRSVVAGFVSAIPLGISILILFGLMGLFGIELNIATAMLSSIMIGVGDDYTIHFLWRYREERMKGLNHRESAQTTLLTTGRGIIFNGFSVIAGFVALFASNFLPVRFFGFLVVVSILSCLIGAMMLIPAICMVLKPKFLDPKK